MSLGNNTWRGRKKRVARRIAYDVRLLLPILGLVGCFALYATAIFAAERLPVAAADSSVATLPTSPAACSPAEAQSGSAFNVDASPSRHARTEPDPLTP